MRVLSSAVPPRLTHTPQNKVERIRKMIASSYHFYEGLEHVCIGAFVVFEHRESKRRCIQDYQQSSAWWGLGGCCIPRFVPYSHATAFARLRASHLCCCKQAGTFCSVGSLSRCLRHPSPATSCLRILVRTEVLRQSHNFNV